MAIQWLEDQTGQNIDYTPETPVAHDHHLSVRLSRELAIALDTMATEHGRTVSQLVRDLLTQAVEQRSEMAALDARALSERLAAVVAEVRRRLAG